MKINRDHNKKEWNIFLSRKEMLGFILFVTIVIVLLLNILSCQRSLNIDKKTSGAVTPDIQHNIYL